MAASALVLAVAAGAVLDRTLLVPAQLPAARIGAASIDIRGPETIAVGETATFTAELDGVGSWVWTLPDQRFVVDSRSVEITASSAGTGELILRAQTPEGRELEVRRSVTVTG